VAYLVDIVANSLTISFHPEVFNQPITQWNFPQGCSMYM